MLCACTDQSSSVSKLTLSSPFSDHMIMQRGTKILIKGNSDPGAKIHADMNWHFATTTANTDGNWALELGPFNAGGPYKLKISSANKAIEVFDILVGDIWLAAGQSNMCWPVKYVNNPESKIKNADQDKEIRFFRNLSSRQKTVDNSVNEKWETTNNKTVVNFSAVAYAFARELYEEEQIPIGIIQACEDNIKISALMNEDVLAKFPEYKEKLLQKSLAMEYWSVGNFVLNQTALEHNAEINIASEGIKVAAWLNENRLENSAAGGFNSFKVLKPMLAYNNRIFIQIQAKDISRSQVDSFYQALAQSKFISESGEIIPITDWHGFEMFEKDFPGNLYDLKIKPITSFPIKGVLWYQGESNISNPSEYKELFTLLVEDWRKQWHNPELPFFSVQLHDFNYEPHVELENFWQVQENLASSIPYHYMVSAKDLGEKNGNVHPRDKDELGIRLARMVLVKSKD